MEAYLPIMLKSCKKKNYFPLPLLSARFVGTARVKCRGRIRAAMLTGPAGSAGLFFAGCLGGSLRVPVFRIAGFADVGCRKNPRNSSRIPGIIIVWLAVPAGGRARVFGT